MSPRYEIVDVFTGAAYTGNPLAVVYGAEGLSGAAMQAIAGEFNLSETAFVLPATDAAADYRVRIFTPAEELPFAGHPSVGTAVALCRAGVVAAGEVVQECGAGLLPITVSAEEATLTGGEITPLRGLDPEMLLAATGLDRADLAGDPYATGAGLEHYYLPVRPAAVARAVSRPREDVPKVYVFAWQPATRSAHARLFGPGVGVAEDPATGSAALGLGAYLVGAGLLPEGGGYTVEQGIEMGRPSVMSCTVEVRDGAAVRVRVTGGAVSVARGELVALPG